MMTPEEWAAEFSDSASNETFAKCQRQAIEEAAQLIEGFALEFVLSDGKWVIADPRDAMAAALRGLKP